MIASPSLLITGIVLLGVGYLLRSWAARHNLIDVAKDAAIGTAWRSVRTRSAPQMPAELSERFEDLKADGTHVGRAKKAAGYAARHIVAQVVGIGGLIAMLLGLVLAALGIFWR